MRASVQLSLLASALGSKIGGCVNSVGLESLVPADPYVVTDITTATSSTGSCSPFASYVSAYGLLFAGSVTGQTVPDNGLKWLAKATTELFPSTASDQDKQKEVLQNMYRYRAANPVFYGQFVDSFDGANGDVRDHISMCDTITIGQPESSNSVNGQIMEVYEHLLHIITDVGFSTTWPSKWGLSTSSDLYAAMQEAIDAGIYDVSSYAGMDAEARDRVKMQEFAYWALSAVQGVHSTYFEGSAAPEWTISTASQVQSQLPLFWALHQATSATVLGEISAATFTALGSLAGGQTAQTATWPIAAAGRGTLGTGTSLTDPCAANPSGGGRSPPWAARRRALLPSPRTLTLTLTLTGGHSYPRPEP